MAISGPIQEVTQSGTGASYTVTIAAPAAGNSLILIQESSLNTIISISGGGVTWASAIAIGGNPLVQVWFGHNSSGVGTTLTITHTAKGGGTSSVNVTEWSGLNNAIADVTGSNTGILDANPSAGSIATLSANSLLISVGAWTANDYSSGPTNSFTRRTSFNDATDFAEGASKIVTSINNYSTAWSLTAGVNWSAVIAAFGAPNSATATVNRSATQNRSSQRGNNDRGR